MDYNMRQIVKMSKSLRSFHNICIEDRIALIKYGFMEVHNMFRIRNSEMRLYGFTLSNVNRN